MSSSLNANEIRCEQKYTIKVVIENIRVLQLPSRANDSLKTFKIIF